MQDSEIIQCLNCREKRWAALSPKTKLIYIGLAWFFLMIPIRILIPPFILFLIWAIFKNNKVCCSVCLSENVVELDLWESAEQEAYFSDDKHKCIKLVKKKE